jgi:hypothetical protein
VSLLFYVVRREAGADLPSGHPGHVPGLDAAMLVGTLVRSHGDVPSWNCENLLENSCFGSAWVCLVVP